MNSTDTDTIQLQPPADESAAIVGGGAPAAAAQLATRHGADDPSTTVVDGHPTPGIKPGPIIAVLVVTAFVMILNETVLSVALPVLMTEFAITATTAQWLSTAFMLTMAVVIPTTGFLLNRFSTRAIFTSALVFFLVGTALAAIAPGFELLLAGRVVQAVGTAMMLPLLMTTTLALVPIAHRGAVMGLSSVVISAAPAFGPTISGLVLGALSWRFLFIFMLPVTVIALVVGLMVIRNYTSPRAMRIDALSVVLSALGFGGLVFALVSIGGLLDGSAPLATIIGGVVGIAGLALFIARQVRLGREGRALLDLRPFAVRNYRASAMVVVVAMLSMLGTVVVLPIYLVGSLGLSVVSVGLVLLPGGAVQAVLGPIVGRLYDRVGARPIVVPGMALMGIAMWLQALLLTDATPVSLIIALNVVFGMGMSMVMTPLMTLALSSLPRELYADGSASMNTLQQLAGAIGTALFVAMLTLGTASATAEGASAGAATADGAVWAFVLGGVLATVATVLALTIRRLPADSQG
ncbi:MDR family MFS transporter [Agrococcus beijingensis]|uniref:MDR family MFS transporter n=1 Tax=Agrococcus beijingensis TaxID=3068634 RepID=UPI0027426FBA|nr:MDR family MFS transporter [Agrococcus sp. REN33]